MRMPWPKPILKRLLNARRDLMASPVKLFVYTTGTGCGISLPPTQWGELRYRNRGPWLVLAKNELLIKSNATLGLSLRQLAC